MAGRFGNERSTMRNLRLVNIDNDRNLLVVRGQCLGQTVVMSLCGKPTK